MIRLLKAYFRTQVALFFLFNSAMFSGFSRKTAAGLLAHAWAKTSFTKPTDVYLALLTGTPTSSSTGTTIEAEEANYTGHERKKVTANISTATEAATSSIENETEITFAACTGGSSTIIAWALCDAATAGNIIMWGTATSTVISTTQTPATIAAKKLIGELK